MQAIAREMNLSETTFVFPATRAECAARVRIFTPAREAPFAGHPTIGTAHVLVSQGRIPPGARRLVLEEGIGPVEILLEAGAAGPDLVWMRHPPATFGAELPDRPAVADALGLADADLLPGAPIQPASTGSTFVFVPLRDRAAVDRAAADVGKLRRLPGLAAFGVFVFAVEPGGGARVYSRMFAPHTSGVPEDPATGSASGALGAYLVRHGLVTSGPEARILSEQGTRMGRQSFVHVRGRVRGGELAEIAVGGQVVPILDGTLRLPL
jgi:trans-2,3-dihydro-3-hydroxyanthranilate isomerase